MKRSVLGKIMESFEISWIRHQSVFFLFIYLFYFFGEG